MDFVGRLLVIERKDLPAECRPTFSASQGDTNVDAVAQPKNNEIEEAKDGSVSANNVDVTSKEKITVSSPYELQGMASQTGMPTALPKQLGPLEVLLQLGRSPRALTAFGLEFTYAIILAALEPT